MASYTGDDTANRFYGDIDHSNSASLRGGDDFAYGGDLSDYFYGEEGNDYLSGSDGSDTLQGGSGNDQMYGGAGDDIIYSGDGLDELYGGVGDDTLNFDSGDIVYAGAGDDYLADYSSSTNGVSTIYGAAGDDYFALIGPAAGYFDGGTGEDTIDYENSDALSGVIVNLLSGLGGGDAAGHTYTLIEDVVGSYLNDTLIGNGSINALYGSFGDDTVAGGGGGDYLDGGDGLDTLDYARSPGAVQVDLGARTAYGADAQEDIFRNFENVSGSAFNDRLTGNGGANVLRGNAGKDMLIGGSGADTLAGGAGDDRLVGGLGADALVGQSGADTFVFASTADSGPGNARDRINDFSHVQGDRIDVSGIDANTAAAKNQAFTFIGRQAFHGKSGELHYAVSGDHAVISGDVNGDKVADFQIVVNYDAAHPFVAADFVL